MDFFQGIMKHQNMKRHHSTNEPYKKDVRVTTALLDIVHLSTLENLNLFQTRLSPI